MARKKKADPETTQTPLETPIDAPAAPEPADTPTVIEPPQDQPERPRQPDPFGLASVALTDEKNGPVARLFRNNRFQAMAIQFPEKPAPEIIEQLRDAGFKWRSDDKVWTTQLDPAAKWQTQANAEKLFFKLTSEIREANVCTSRSVA